MIDYSKIERIAEKLEQQLGITTEKDETEQNPVEQALPEALAANDVSAFEKECGEVESIIAKAEGKKKCECTGKADCKCPECEGKKKTASRIATLKRLIKLANDVKANKSLTAKQRADALEKIRMASGLNKSVINNPSSMSGITNVNTRGKLRDLYEKLDETKKGMKLYEIVKEFNISSNSLLKTQLGNYTVEQLFNFLFAFVEKIENEIEKKEKEMKDVQQVTDDTVNPEQNND